MFVKKKECLKASLFEVESEEVFEELCEKPCESVRRWDQRLGDLWRVMKPKVMPMVR